MLAAASLSHGAVIASNPITDANPQNSNPFTTGQTVADHVTFSGIGRGEGIAGNSGANRYNASSWNSTSLDSTAYFYFILTPESGYELDLASFVYTGQRSSTGANTFAFRSSVDSYASDIGFPTATGTTIDLAAYQNITTSIEFRLYGWGASAAAGTFSVNDFTFNGEVNSVSPTPTISAALATAGVGTNLGTATVNGSSPDFVFANVATGGATSGYITIDGDLATSASAPVLVYLDLVDTSNLAEIVAAIDDGSGVVDASTGSFALGNGITYDLLLTFSSNPSVGSSFVFNFAGFGVNNIAVVPEPSMAVLGLIPAAGLIRRRR